MSNDQVLILGGTSDIGQATAYKFAENGYAIRLAARDLTSLHLVSADIHLRFRVDVSIHHLEINDHQSIEELLLELPAAPAIVICAIGLLGDQKQAEENSDHAVEIMRANYEGPAITLGRIADLFEQKGRGTIVGISSVAGSRGRGSNYVYGSAKAAFTAYLSGLRNRLEKKGVKVITILPGFVETKMTAHLNLPARITAKPSEVAAAIYRAVQGKDDVVYVKKVWRVIIWIIVLLPESIFKKTEF